MDERDPYETCLAYLWMRKQLTESEAKRYRKYLRDQSRGPNLPGPGLDSALIEAAEKIAQALAEGRLSE